MFDELRTCSMKEKAQILTNFWTLVGYMIHQWFSGIDTCFPLHFDCLDLNKARISSVLSISITNS